MAFQYAGLQSLDGGANGAELGQDFRAIPVFLDHFFDARNLPGDAVDAWQIGQMARMIVGFLVHKSILYPWGVYTQAENGTMVRFIHCRLTRSLR